MGGAFSLGELSSPRSFKFGLTSAPTIPQRLLAGRGAGDLSFPVALSPDSFQDFVDHLNIIIRQAKRRSEAEQRGEGI
jgi:hypothetical protein